MVLKMVFVAAGLGLSFGCNQSLFDAHRGSGGADPDAGPDAPPGQTSTCPAPCLGDSNGDFDGTAAGKTGRWRYLDDHRDRTWAPMTAMADGFVGANPANAIRACTADSNAAACQALPNALLVSTASFATPGADPAIEFTAEANRTVELQLSVHIPAGGFGQTVRLYRNSREDVLFTGSAEPGVTLTHSITVDALAGDRFLVAIAPPAFAQPDIGVRLYIVGANATFPTECQLALSFSTLTGLTTDDACRGIKFTAMHDQTVGTAAPALVAGPFSELGKAASIAQHNFYNTPAALVRPGDVTIDLWTKHTRTVDQYVPAWLYSEHNRQYLRGGGLSIYIMGAPSTPRIYAETVYTPELGTVDYVGPGADYPTDQKWHFVRAVHKADGAIKLCIDGVYKGMDNAPGTLKPYTPPHIGHNGYDETDPAGLIGSVDDIRVLNTALPCE